jgi:hypothetical protein
MRHAALVLPAAICATIALSAADRLTDRDVKALVSRIEQGRDRFDDALDGKLKRSIVRGPGGEVNVEDFLNDFQQSIDTLEERLKPEYAGSTEVGTLLRQATSIHRFFSQQPAGTKGESEWTRLESDLKALAFAYGTDFPLPENATTRRIGDGELGVSLGEIAEHTAGLKKTLDNELKRDPTIAKQVREGMTAQVEQLSKAAKSLRGRVKDAQPSSAEAGQLLSLAAQVQASLESRRVPASKAAWAGAIDRLQIVASAYRTSWPAAR